MIQPRSARSKARSRIVYVCISGLIAALYVVLSFLVQVLGLAGGAVQLRISEALCVLPFFTTAAIPGVTVGCFLFNLLSGGIWQDVLFGTLATLLGALGARLLRRVPYLMPLPTVLANTAIIPFVLAYGYHAPEGIGFLFFSVGLGEVLSAYVAGMVLWNALKRYDVFRRLRLQ